MSAFGPLLSASELGDARARLLDVRWDITNPAAGREQFLAGHVPGAAFVDLDCDLAAPPGAGGRHPLPDTTAFQTAMQRAGVCGDRPVVVYDAADSMAAARAWWLLRYFGHPEVAVLDGGFAAWVAGGGAVEAGAGAGEPGDFVARPGGMPLLDADGALALARRGVLLDARAAERYRGEIEPFDPVAGHIPGARSLPAAGNVDADGRFLPPGGLRERFAHAGVSGEVGAYCGSGVVAAHEVLALELAGYPAALYVGSWSDWITDPSRPVAVGSE